MPCRHAEEKSMSNQSPLTTTGFVPSEHDTQSLLEWFARYDELVRRNDTEAMADMALFPLIVMTNDSAGDCVTQEWDRETFVQAMAMNMEGSDPAAMDFVNEREPVFLNSDLAVVVTSSTVTMNGQEQHMRYVDIMAKQDGQWRFKSMIQAGWGDMLKEYLGA
jgi:ketosteroid isomerase-like protein